MILAVLMLVSIQPFEYIEDQVDDWRLLVTREGEEC